MKHVIKLLITIFFLPFFALAGIIAIVKTFIVLTLGIAWETGDEWHKELIINLDKFMRWLKR